MRRRNAELVFGMVFVWSMILSSSVSGAQGPLDVHNPPAMGIPCSLETANISVQAGASLSGVSAPAATYYVDPEGNDLLGDGSPDHPWATLSHACDRVQTATDTIHLNVGSYVDNNQCALAVGVNIEGVGKDLVTITGMVPGDAYIYAFTENPSCDTYAPVAGNHEISGFTLDGGDRSTPWGIRVRGRDEVRIHDVKVQNYGWSAIRVEPCYQWTNSRMTAPTYYGEGVELYRIETDHTTTDDPGFPSMTGAITLQAIKDLHLHDVTINEEYVDAGVGIKHADSGWLNRANIHDVTIRTDTTDGNCFSIEVYNFENDSEIYDSTFYHSHSIGGGPQTRVPGSEWNLKFHHNEIDVSGLVHAGEFAFEGYHNWFDFYSNYVHGSGGLARGFGLWKGPDGYLMSLGTDHVRIRNNVFHDLYIYAFGIHNTQGLVFEDIRVYNNVIDTIDVGSWGAGIWTDGDALFDNFQVLNNIIMNVGTGGIGHAVAFQASGSNADASFNYFSGEGSNSIYVHPSCSNCTQSHNTIEVPGIVGSGLRPYPYYYPASGGANIVDAGTDLSTEFSDDYRGTTRPQGAGWDIGAFEFAPSLLLTAVPGNRTIYLNWTVDATLPVTATWQIDYEGPVGDQPPPITGIVSPTRAYTLTGLTNYVWYTVTLSAMLGSTPLLSDTVRAMPTDIAVYLPLVWKAR